MNQQFWTERAAIAVALVDFILKNINLMQKVLNFSLFRFNFLTRTIEIVLLIFFISLMLLILLEIIGKQFLEGYLGFQPSLLITRDCLVFFGIDFVSKTFKKVCDTLEGTFEV